MLLLIWYWIIHVRIGAGGLLQVSQVLLNSTFLLQVCSLLLLWSRVGWWDFTVEVGSEQRFKDEVLDPDVSGSVCSSVPQLRWIYKRVGWILAELFTAACSRLLVSAWGNLSVDSFFLIIPAVLHPIALAVTYRNEWQRAAHSRAVLWVHYKSRFPLELQPRKLSARSDFHSESEKSSVHLEQILQTCPLLQQHKRSPRDVLKCCRHSGYVQYAVQPLWHQLL